MSNATANVNCSSQNSGAMNDTTDGNVINMVTVLTNFTVGDLLQVINVQIAPLKTS